MHVLFNSLPSPLLAKHSIISYYQKTLPTQDFNNLEPSDIYNAEYTIAFLTNRIS